MESLEEARQSGTGVPFAKRLLDLLDIRFNVTDVDLRRIPVKGSAVVVANHPYGILDGLILMVVLGRVRPDCKMLTNSWLRWIEELRQHMIPVNPFELGRRTSKTVFRCARL
jgi:putative hemolysin